MKPDLSRLILGPLGLAIGFTLYAGAARLPAPWADLSIGGLFVALGVAAFLYARGERWIQVLGLVLGMYGLLRATVLG